MEKKTLQLFTYRLNNHSRSLGSLELIRYTNFVLDRVIQHSRRQLIINSESGIKHHNHNPIIQLNHIVRKSLNVLCHLNSK
jgi:hypothetical protein